LVKRRPKTRPRGRDQRALAKTKGQDTSVHKIAPKLFPGELLALSERLRHHAKAAHADQKFAADLKDSALAIRRLACIMVMLDESKIDLNPHRRESIEREVIALWQACI